MTPLLSLLLACTGATDVPLPDGSGTPTEDSPSSTTPTEPTSRSLLVHVDLDGAPAAGVSVIQGGRTERWTTDADGNVTITVDFTVNGDIYVMASHPDARIQGDNVSLDEAEPFVITLTRFSTTDNEAYVFQDPGEGDPTTSTSATCLHCHISIHEDWWASAHRTSASNTPLHDLYQGMATGLDEARCLSAGGQWDSTLIPGSREARDGCRVGASVLEDTSGYGGCADCHAPGIDGVLGGRDLLDASGVSFAYGVHCDVCHKIDDVDVTGLPGLAGAVKIVRPSETPSSPVFGEWAPLTFGPWDDVPNPRMGSVHRPLYHEARLCAGCHQSEQAVLTSAGSLDLTRWPGGKLPIHTTYAEWEQSAFNPAAPCQSCHMPPDPAPASGADLYDGHKAKETGLVGVATGWERPPGSVRKHNFFGPRQPDSRMLQLAATVDVALRVEAGTLVVDTTVKNVGPGHALPTGEPLRAVLLGVTAACDGSPLVASGGPVLPEWAGWLDRRTDPEAWPGAQVGDVIRVVRSTGTWTDYVGFGPFGDGTFTAAQKGLPGEESVGEATVVAVDGETITLSAPLPEGDVAYRVSGGARAGEPGFAFARVTADATGRAMVPHFAAVDVVSDNRLLPGASWTTTHRFVSPCARPTATATLVHRNYPWALAAERGWTLSDQTMATSTRTAP